MWAFFGRVEDVAACLPGASLDGGEKDGVVNGKMRVKVGPISAEFSGVAQITRDEAAHRGAIVGSGRDTRSNSATRGIVAYSVKPDEGGAGSRVDVDVGYTLTGMLAQFGRSGLVQDIASRLTAAFAQNLEARLSAGSDGAAAPPLVRELNAGSLITTVLLGRVKDLVQKDLRPRLTRSRGGVERRISKLERSSCLSYGEGPMGKFSAIYDRSRVPLYLQVASVMRQRINSGYWAEGEQISTLEELEEEFSLARVTIRQAIELLRAEGLLQAQQGRGTFVSGRPVNNRWLNLATDFDSLVESIRNNVLKRVFIQRDAEPPVLIPGEGNPANAYTFFRSVQFNSGKPFSVVNLHLDQRLFLRDSKRFTRSAALPKIVEMEDVVITHAYQRFTIGVADPETADLLEIGLGEPTADCQLTSSTTRTSRSTSPTSTTSRIASFCAAICFSTAHRATRPAPAPRARRPRSPLHIGPDPAAS